MQNGFIPKLTGFWHKRESTHLGKILLPLVLVYRRIRNLRQALRRNVWSLSGAVREEPFNIFFAGGEKNKLYLADMVFGYGRWTENYLGHLWLWRVYITFRRFRTKFQLGIVEINQKFASLFRNSFFVPAWTGGVIDLLDEKRNTLGRKKRDLRRIRKFCFTPEITNDPGLFRHFHENMYLPFVKNSHGRHAFLAAWEDIEAVMHESELLLLRRGEKFIAGAIIHYRNGLAHLWINGVLEGSQEYLKIGVIGALDHFAGERILEKGYAQMHYGGSRPFLKDGVLNYKRDRGLILRDSVPRGFLISPVRNSHVSRNFFLENPFIHVEKQKLAGALFLEENANPDMIRSAYQEFFMRGMSCLNIFMTNEVLPEVPAELAGKIVIRPCPF